MKQHGQHEAILAFSFALLLQLFGLLLPSDGHSVFLRAWLEDLRWLFVRPTSAVGLFEIFYIGVNLLWLSSPFMTRTYGQSPAIRKLAMSLSIVATVASGFWLLTSISKRPCVYILLGAAIAHTVGMLLIRKEEPGPS